MKATETQAFAWASQAALHFQIPSQASLHGIVKTHRSICSANDPAWAAGLPMPDSGELIADEK